MIVHVLVVVGLLVCAIQAVRVQRLLLSALWLAGTSALVALELYLFGAPEVAVIELSVGAGLVTVLFVFAINIAGEEAIPVQSLIPKPLAWILVLTSVGLLGWMNASILGIQVKVQEVLQMQFADVVWGDRLLDVLLQITLIFAGVLGVLGLLAESRSQISASDHNHTLTGSPKEPGMPAVTMAAKPVSDGPITEDAEVVLPGPTLIKEDGR